MIAEKNPAAVQATKKNLVYSLEHTNQEGLDQIVRANNIFSHIKMKSKKKN